MILRVYLANLELRNSSDLSRKSFASDSYGIQGIGLAQEVNGTRCLQVEGCEVSVQMLVGHS